MKNLIALAAAVAVASGCAGANYRPVVDTQGVDPARYALDLQECQQFATQRADAAQGALIGAAFLGALGAVLSHNNGLGRYNRNAVVADSATMGAVAGVAGAEMTQRNIIIRCLAGRGYRVLE